jgi:predicted alpha/beta-hydrolase family hydrolase
MKTRKLSIKVSATIGSVSAECFIPAKPECMLTLAHGAGAGMHHTFMVTLSERLAEKGIATMRFNFPFSENQKGRPDTPAVAHQTIAAAISKAQKLYADLPLFVSGKSFGGRMSSQYISENSDVAVNGLIFYGFPLHGPGKPSVDRAEHLKTIKKPMLFLQGTRDELATWDLIEQVCSSLKPATLIRIEGANHAFKAGKQDVIQRLADETKLWIRNRV